MKKEVSYTAVISVTITALVAGFLLSSVNSSFKEEIEINKKKELLKGIKSVIIGSDTVEGPLTENSTFTYYIGKKEDGSIAGYAILSSAKGYNGENKVLVGFDENAETVTGIAITEQSETPGLGAKIVKEPFTEQFKEQSSIVPLSIVKGIKPEEASEGEIAAISGATISSTSVVDAVNIAKDEAVSLFLK